MRRYRWVTVSGLTGVVPSSGASEDEAALAELGPEHDGLLGTVVQVGTQECEGLGVEDDPAPLVGLGVLLPYPRHRVGQCSIRPQDCGGEVDVAPP